MRPRVYIETTIPSYLTCRPSADPIRLGHELETRLWWDSRRGEFELVTSQLVHDECAGGDRNMASLRLAVLAGLPLLEPIPLAEELADTLSRKMSLPPRAAADATHVALATVYGVEYLLTWNCRHLANPALWGRITATCLAAGCRPPAICTPGIFLEDEP